MTIPMQYYDLMHSFLTDNTVYLRIVNKIFHSTTVVAFKPRPHPRRLSPRFDLSHHYVN